MGLYSIKDYLTLEDVADYLDDMGIFAVNWLNDRDCGRFAKLLFELYSDDKLTPLIKLNYPRPATIFHFNQLIADILDFDDDGVQVISQKESEVDGMAVLCYADFFKFMQGLKPFHNSPEIYIEHFEPYNQSLDDNCLIEFKEEYRPRATLSSIVFPKSEIIAIFGNSPYNQTVPRLKEAKRIVSEQAQTINNLQQQNSELKNRIAELESQSVIPTINSKREQQGNSLLILGAVLDCLDSETIRNYNQTALIATVIEKHGNITGISQSTLNKKFAEAKRYFSQHQ